MEFYVQVSDGVGSWEERYSRPDCADLAAAEAWARATIDWFNRTIVNPKERPRAFVSVRAGEGKGPSTQEHAWTKTSVTTLSDHRGAFDKVRCRVCGIEARRYELTRIVRQSPWRSRKWSFCSGSSS